jgi:hypothetical protein
MRYWKCLQYFTNHYLHRSLQSHPMCRVVTVKLQAQIQLTVRSVNNHLTLKQLMDRVKLIKAKIYKRFYGTGDWTWLQMSLQIYSWLFVLSLEMKLFEFSLSSQIWITGTIINTWNHSWWSVKIYVSSFECWCDIV